MQTNLMSWISGSPGMDSLVHAIGVAVVIVILPVALITIIIVVIVRNVRPARSVHPIGRTMFPADLPRGREQVLLVDDEPVTLQVQSAILAELGYTCHTVTSGEAAVAFIREHPVDIVLLDLVMDPGINGVETLRQIKQIAPKVVAILVSGYARPSDVAAAQAMGAGAYLIKPVASGMLATEVRRALDSRKRR